MFKIRRDEASFTRQTNNKGNKTKKVGQLVSQPSELITSKAFKDTNFEVNHIHFYRFLT